MGTLRLLAIGVLAGAALMPGLPASATNQATLVAQYNFDVINGNTVADVTNKGHTLTLNGSWTTTTGAAGSQAVSFQPFSMGDSPSKTDLNPSTKGFAVTTVFKLPGDISNVPDTPNIVQKGFFNDPGQWKMQLKPSTAIVQCRFKGTTKAVLLSSQVQGVDDGAWHTSTCWRDGTQLGVTVDGVTTQITANVGSIASGRSLRVGAKSLSAATDQFTGSLDYVAVAVGPNAAAVTQMGAPPTG
ncbi:MAG: LamG-like jellyroll fold domain-containing protein [Candidatus Nanopelagicales bacterium]